MMLNMNQKEMLILLVTLIVIDTAAANWWHWTASTTGKTSFLYIPLLTWFIFILEIITNGLRLI